MTKPLHDVFLENTRARMKELGLSQKQLATEMGVTPATICQLLQGQWKPSLEVIQNVARALKISPLALLQESLLTPS